MANKNDRKRRVYPGGTHFDESTLPMATRRRLQRNRYLSYVMKQVNGCLVGMTGHFAKFRPVFILDLNDPSCVTVQIFDGTGQPGKERTILTNRKLFAVRRAWGYLDLNPVTLRWKWQLAKKLGVDRTIHTDQLLFQIRLDLEELNPTTEKIEFYFSNYKRP